MTPIVNRRDFLAASAALAAIPSIASASPNPRNTLPKGPTDKVTLGKTGIQVSLVGMGTGSPRLGSGQQPDQARREGVHPGCPPCPGPGHHPVRRGGSVRLARLSPRSPQRASLATRYVIQTKTHATDFAAAKSHLERYRMELGVDMIDIVLLHCMHQGGLAGTTTQGSMDYLRSGQIRGADPRPRHELSWDGPVASPRPRNPFVEVDLARINPEGLIMDDKKPDEVASRLEEMHTSGKGVVGMKILGEGAFKEPERRDASLRYVLGLGTVDSFVIGFESPEQVDDLIKRTADAIAFVGKR